MSMRMLDSFAAAAEFVLNHVPQLVHIEFGGIDDVVGHSADGRQQLAFGPDAL